jgi:sugar lactone lactonase YvrE
VWRGGTGPFTYQWQFNGTNLPNNIITTVAGNGSGTGYSGDGGAATNASLWAPSAWPWMPSATCILLTPEQQRIRKVDTNGIITTVAGNGTALFRGRRRGHQRQLYYPSGVALDASGNLYIADSANNASARWTPTASSPPWRAMAAPAIPGTAARPPTPA